MFETLTMIPSRPRYRLRGGIYSIFAPFHPPNDRSAGGSRLIRWISGDRRRMDGSAPICSSKLFLLCEDAVIDRVAQGFRHLPPHELIASNLSTEQEAKLRDAFAQVHSIDRRSTASAELCRISPEVKEWKLYLP